MVSKGTAGGSSGKKTVTTQGVAKNKIINGQGCRVIGEYTLGTYDESDMKKGEKKVNNFLDTCFNPLAIIGAGMSEKEVLHAATERDYSHASETLKNAGLGGIEMLDRTTRADMRAFESYIARGKLKDFEYSDFSTMSRLKAGQTYRGVELSQRDLDMINRYLHNKMIQKTNKEKITRNINNLDLYLASRGMRGMRLKTDSKLKRISKNEAYHNNKLTEEDREILKALSMIKKDKKILSLSAGKSGSRRKKV